MSKGFLSLGFDSGFSYAHTHAYRHTYAILPLKTFFSLYFPLLLILYKCDLCSVLWAPQNYQLAGSTLCFWVSILPSYPVSCLLIVHPAPALGRLRQRVEVMLRALPRSTQPEQDPKSSWAPALSLMSFHSLRQGFLFFNFRDGLKDELQRTFGEKL
jgi:hypothetical protein